MMELKTYNPTICGDSITALHCLQLPNGYRVRIEGSIGIVEPHAPAVWNGTEDGLPPVGLEVEVLWSSFKGDYVTGKILAHDEGRAVYRFTTGERKGEYQAEGVFVSVGMGGLPNFRPIRTAEQQAAEERERGITGLVNASSSDEHPGITRMHAAALYDAGARIPREGRKS